MENTEVKEIEKDVKSQEQIDAELSEEIFIESMKAEEDAHNALVAERDDFKNKYLYTLAELDNTKKRFATDIVADEAHFVDAKSEMPQAAPQSSYIPDAYTQPKTAATTPVFEDINPDSEELPF